MPTPSLSTIRSAVITAIKTGMNPGSPNNVTTVHAYRRFWRDRNYFESIFKRPSNDLSGWTGLVNGWMVEVVASEEEAPELFRFYTKYKFKLHGYLGVQDVAPGRSSPKTENDFLDQVEAIRDQLRLNTSIFGNTEATTPVAQVEQTETVQIADCTCWYALVTFEAESIATKFS